MLLILNGEFLNFHDNCGVHQGWAQAFASVGLPVFITYVTNHNEIGQMDQTLITKSGKGSNYFNVS